MRPGVVASSARNSTSLVGILGGLSNRFGGVVLTVMYNVTGCVDRAASSTSFSRIQGISACEMFNYGTQGNYQTKRTTLRNQGYPHLMDAYKDVGMCRSLRIKAKCER